MFVWLAGYLFKALTWWAGPGLVACGWGLWLGPPQWYKLPVWLPEWQVWKGPATNITLVINWLLIWFLTKDGCETSRALKILATHCILNYCFIFCTCRSQLLWLSLSRRGKRPSPFLDLMNCFHFHTYFSNRYCLRNSAFPWGFDTASWPVVIESETVKSKIIMRFHYVTEKN